MTEAAHVRGQVWRPDGHAAADAVVTLTDPRGAQVGSATAGAGGTFAVAVPQPGRFLMVVAAPGHEPWVRYVTTAGTDVEMPVVLAESAAPPPSSDGAGTFSAFDAPAVPSRVAQPASSRPHPPASPSFGQPGSPSFDEPASSSFDRSTAASAFYERPVPPPEPPAAHVASTPEQGFTGQAHAAPGPAPRADETSAVAAQAALNAIAEGRPMPANSLYGLVAALLASRIDLETDPGSQLARTAARIGGARGGSLPESQDAADAILAPLARQLLTDDEPSTARHVRQGEAAAPENVIALLRPLIEALAADLETRTAR